MAKRPPKAALERARRAAIGQCAAMVARKGGEPSPCPHWGLERVSDRAYCGQHLNSILLEADRSRREQIKQDAIAQRIEVFVKWTTLHPSVHDRMSVRTS